jgi:hypothetical protein
MPVDSTRGTSCFIRVSCVEKRKTKLTISRLRLRPGALKIDVATRRVLLRWYRRPAFDRRLLKYDVLIQRVELHIAAKDRSR